MENDFNIVYIRDALDHIDDKKLIKLDAFTMAKVYLGTNKLYYLIPAVGYKGIEAFRQETIDSMLEAKHIPIEEDKTNIFQANTELILNLPTSANKIILSFFREKNLEIDFEDISFDFKKFDCLINKTKGKARYEAYGFIIGILLGEKLRINNNAKWVLEKRYGYNPYFEPLLYNEKDRVKYNPWYRSVRTLVSSRKFDFIEALTEILSFSNQ